MKLSLVKRMSLYHTNKQPMVTTPLSNPSNQAAR